MDFDANSWRYSPDQHDNLIINNNTCLKNSQCLLVKSVQNVPTYILSIHLIIK